MNAGTCPNEADLLAWADQAEGSEAIGAHVETCPTCRQQLDELLQSLTQVRLSFQAQPPQADAQASRAAASPSSLGKYLVVGRLAEALADRRGFESFRGLHPLLHVDLRIDLAPEAVPNAAEYREPIAAETRRLLSIEQGHLSRIRDSGFFEDRLYLVADYGQEERLDQRLSEGPIESQEAASIVSALAEAAVPLAEAALVPRELNPSGILLRAEAGPLWTDWGAACALCPSSTGGATAPTHHLLACLFVDLVAPRPDARHDPASARTAIDHLGVSGRISAVTAKALRTALDSPTVSAAALSELSGNLSRRDGLWARWFR
jgi:hypothetical protein